MLMLDNGKEGGKVKEAENAVGTINKIIDIDNRTSELEERTKKEIEKIREKTRETLSKMENISNEEAKREGKEIFDKIIAQSLEQSNKINEEIKENLSRIDSNFEKMKDELVKECFRNIILKGKYE